MHSGNESDWYPWRCWFNPWPQSVGRGSGVAMSCGVGHRHGLAPALLWLWCRLAAVASIWPLAWELPCAMGTALKSKKKKKKKNQTTKKTPNKVKVNMRLSFKKEKKTYARISEGDLSFLYSCAILKILSHLILWQQDHTLSFFLFPNKETKLRNFSQVKWLAQAYGAESQATDLLIPNAQFFSLLQKWGSFSISSNMLCKFTPLPENREGVG